MVMKNEGAVKIVGLELENVKRVAVLRMEPSENGLTVIGGDNGQGKTSVLDAICFALGGERHRPSNLKRDGAIASPYIKLTLSNGLVVERKGKSSTLKITDPSGGKTGQAILDSFVEELALDLPKFLNAKSKDKAKYLLDTLEIGETLAKLDIEETKLFNERHALGQIADRKKKYSEELPWHDGVPETPMTASELMQESQGVMRRNAERQAAKAEILNLKTTLAQKESRLDELRKMIQQVEKEIKIILAKLDCAKEPDAEESTAEIESKMAEIEEINAKVRANLDKERANSEAKAAASEYDKVTCDIDDVRRRRMALLDGAKMPLPGLSVDNGELTLHGKKWDCMSGSEQLRAATAIVRAINHKCGFVLLDGLEAMDVATMTAFSSWLESEGLQAIATRVSKGGECSIVIEDGRAVGVETAVTAPTITDVDPDMEGF